MASYDDYEGSLKRHYQRAGLSDLITNALARAGREITSYEDTAALDEFHMRGREATRELARLAELRPGAEVLDLGCGLGGPARLLAAEFDCRVTGIDIMPEYIEAAEMLTAKAGLSSRISYRTGNMLDMPFDDRSFDGVWSQHTFMNIEDKSRLLSEVHRVLRRDGLLVCYEIMTGERTPVHYPVQWASDETISFLLAEKRMVDLIEATGFQKVRWQDQTDACLKWFQSVVKRMGRRPKDAPPPLALNLVIGRTTAEKAGNTVRNLAENRIRVAYGVFRKSAIAS